MEQERKAVEQQRIRDEKIAAQKIADQRRLEQHRREVAAQKARIDADLVSRSICFGKLSLLLTLTRLLHSSAKELKLNRRIPVAMSRVHLDSSARLRPPKKVRRSTPQRIRNGLCKTKSDKDYREGLRHITSRM